MSFKDRSLACLSCGLSLRIFGLKWWLSSNHDEATTVHFFLVRHTLVLERLRNQGVVFAVFLLFVSGGGLYMFSEFHKTACRELQLDEEKGRVSTL